MNANARKPISPDDAETGPQLAETEWDGVTDDAEAEPGEDDLPTLSGQPEEPDGALPEEDDDNPYQDSDEALPDDREEKVLRRNPGLEDGRFDEV